MRQPILTASLLVAACAMLAACDTSSDEPDESAIDESNVSGEVLEGTISDDMLPLEELRSTPPQADAAAEAGASGAASEATSADTTDDVADQPEESVTVETFEEAFPANTDEAAD